jgi:hypothetical protein
LIWFYQVAVLLLAEQSSIRQVDFVRGVLSGWAFALFEKYGLLRG